MNPFVIDIPESQLADLRRRLDSTDLPPDYGNEDWRYGITSAYMAELLEHWRTRYDWREQERAMNAYAHFRTDIDGVPVHFVHHKGKGPRPIPLLLGHGWPWTFWDLHKVLGPLTDPAAHGGDASDAFDIVLPSLPGFAFSNPLAKAGVNWWRTADLWLELMRRLGYERFGAQGGDWGAFVAAQLGHKHAGRMIGIHLHLAAPLDLFTGGAPRQEDYDADEEEWRKRGFHRPKASRPQTISHALHDSPAGLMAWLLERRRGWSDCGGNVETRFSKDDLITGTMIYWLTRSFAPSARFHYEAVKQPWQPSHGRTPVVEAPTGIAVFPRDVIVTPKRWAERYYNLKRRTVMPRGGHFAPMEEPALLVEEIRAFFRPLRNQ